MKKWVLMISPNAFPNGDAGALRDESFAKIYKELDFSPIILCKNQTVSKGIHNDIEFYSLFREANSRFSKLKRFISYKADLKRIISLLTQERGNPSVIHLYDAPPSAIQYIKHYAKNNQIPLVHDSVEWYSPCEFKAGRFDKSYILKDRLNRYYINDQFKVIAISTYLQNHFSGRGIKTVRIPVIMDVLNLSVSRCDGKKIKFIYAGNPASKDYLAEIVAAFEQLSDEEEKRVQFNIYGISEERLRKMTNKHTLPACIKVYGRVPRDQIIEALLDTDFSFLIRPTGERYAKAGFPTKSVEAMSHGVAMICNITSDLGMYLKDTENAIIINDTKTEDVLDAIKRTLKLSRSEINTIKSNARKLAEDEFDYRNWVHSVEMII